MYQDKNTQRQQLVKRKLFPVCVSGSKAYFYGDDKYMNQSKEGVLTVF